MRLTRGSALLASTAHVVDLTKSPPVSTVAAVQSAIPPQAVTPRMRLSGLLNNTEDARPSKIVRKSAVFPRGLQAASGAWSRDVWPIACNFTHIEATVIDDGGPDSGQVSITTSTKREVIQVAPASQWTIGAGLVGKETTKIGIYVCYIFSQRLSVSHPELSSG